MTSIDWKRVFFGVRWGLLLLVVIALFILSGCATRTVVIRPGTPDEAVGIARRTDACVSLYADKRVVIVPGAQYGWGGVYGGELTSLQGMLQARARLYGMEPLATPAAPSGWGRETPTPAHDLRIEVSVTSSDANHYRVDLALIEVETERVLANGTGAAWYDQGTYGYRHYYGLNGRVKPTRLEAIRSAASDAAEHLLCVRMR